MGVTQKFLLSLSDSFTENYLQPEQIARFIQKQSRILFQQITQKGIESFSGSEYEMLLRVSQRLPVLRVDVSSQELKIEERKKSPEDYHAWQIALEKGRVINKGIFKSQSAVILLSMFDSEDKPVSEFLDKNMELLLRHVEVKREQALHRFTEPCSKQASWEERCIVGVLFSAFAEREKDWRFLNGALKLNEWLWKEYHRLFSGLSPFHLLATLVEQEVVFKELQSC